VKRLSIMFDIGAEADAAESEEGDDFAGSYFDNSASQFALVVRTKKANKPDRILKRKARVEARRDPAAKAKRRAERRAMRAKFKLTDSEVEQAEDILGQDVQVPLKFKVSAVNSVRALQAAISSSGQSFAAIPGFQTAFVDNKTGEVVVMVDAKSPDVASAEVAKFLKVPYRIELVPGGFVNVALRGGQFSSVPGQRWCMTSFAAKHNTTGKPGLVTAGHCASGNTISLNDGGTNYAMTQGAPLNSATAGDLMFLSGAPTAVAEFYADGIGPVRPVTGTRSRANTTAGNGTMTTAGTTTGSFVCHLGQQTLGSSNVVQSCGEVVSTAATTTTATQSGGAFTGGSYVLVRNTQSGAGTLSTTGTGTLLCFQGDSGGPWFAGTTAFGVMSSCGWKDRINGTAQWAVYTSVDAFSSIGVTILVK
jgi:hypothetical protein